MMAQNLKILALLVGAVTLPSCQMSPDFTPTPNPTVDTTNNGAPEDSEAGKHALGIKNYQQIYDSMKSATGLTQDFFDPSGNDDNVNADNSGNNNRLPYFAYFRDNRLSLPSNNEINGLGPTQILTVANLAYQFCFYLMNTQAERQRFFGAAPFNLPSTNPGFLPASLLLHPDNQQVLARTLLSRFWGSYTDEDLSHVISLINELVQNRGNTSSSTTPIGNDATGTIRVLAGTCTAVLGSSRIILF